MTASSINDSAGIKILGMIQEIWRYMNASSLKCLQMKDANHASGANHAEWKGL